MAHESHSHGGAPATANDHGNGHGVGHIVPIWLLATVLAILLLLTVVTVAVTYVPMGPLNVWVALFIATIKATLVALYFMHLRYDRPFNGVILVASLVFVMLFVGFALTDTSTYQHSIINREAPAMLRTK